MTPLRAIIILLTGLVGIAGLSSLFIYRKESRLEAFQEHLREAQRQIETDPPAAVAEIEVALRLQPDNQEALLKLFDTIAYFEPERGRQLLERLSHLGIEPEKLIYRELQMAMTRGDGSPIAGLMARLEQNQPLGREGTLARAYGLLAQGQAEIALPLLAELAAAHPNDRELRLITAQLLAQDQQLIQRIRAKNILMELSRQHDETGFRAALILLHAGTLPLFPEDISWVTARLRTHPWLREGLARVSAPEIRRIITNSLPHDPEFARICAEELLAGTPETEDWNLALYVAQTARDTGLAARAAAWVAANAPDRAESRLLLARQAAADADYARALELINAIAAAGQEADSTNLVRTAGYILQNHYPALQPEQRERLIDLVFDAPQPEIPVLVETGTYLLNRTETNRDAIINRMLEHIRDIDPGKLGTWLLSVRGYEHVLQVIDHTTALSSAQLLPIRLDALMMLERTDDVRALLDEAGAVMEPWRQQLFQIGVASDSGDAATALRIIEQFLAEMPPAARPFLFLVSRKAAENGSPGLQAAALERAYQAGLTFPFAESLTYLQWLVGQMRSDEATRFTAFCRTLRPDNPVYINNHTYMLLINGLQIEKSIRDMESLLDENPRSAPFQLTLALAELLGGYTGRAREHLESIDGLDAIDDPRSRLTIAIILAGSGNSAAAAEILETLDLSQFLPLERRLVDLYTRDGTF